MLWVNAGNYTTHGVFGYDTTMALRYRSPADHGPRAFTPLASVQGVTMTTRQQKMLEMQATSDTHQLFLRLVLGGGGGLDSPRVCIGVLILISKAFFPRDFCFCLNMFLSLICELVIQLGKLEPWQTVITQLCRKYLDFSFGTQSYAQNIG